MTEAEAREIWGDEAIDALDLGTLDAVLQGGWP